MTDLRRIQLNERIDSLSNYSSSLRQSINLVRLIGYGLLALAGLDLLQIFSSPEFSNPVWEFELIGQLVERVAVPLIGLGLVFMGQQVSRKKREHLVLKSLSWVSLLVAFLFMSLIPLNIVSTVRLERQGNNQFTAQLNQAKSQLQEAQAQIEEIGTLEQAEQLFNRFDPQGRAVNISEDQTLDELRQTMVMNLSRGERQFKNQAVAAKKERRRRLFKNSIKWSLGAMMSSILFFYIWRSTDWARKYR